MEEQELQTPETNYIEAINTLKNTTVSRDEYNRVLNDNKKMVEMMMSSTPKSTEEEVKIPTDDEVQEIRKKLFTSDNGMTNLEYMTNALKLRSSLIQQGKRDPFLPVNHDYVDNETDAATAEMYAQKLQEMIDYANGDPEVFNSELKRCCK